MKKIFLLVLAAATLTTACNQRAANQFDIHGNIAGADGQTIYMHRSLNDSSVIDSAVIENGKFAFSGTTELVAPAYLYIGMPTFENKATVQTYVEPGAEITIDSLTAEDFSAAVIKGSATQAYLEKYNAGYRPYVDRIMALRQEASTADAAAQDSLEVLMDDANDELQKFQKEFITSNASSPFAAILLNQMCSMFSFDDLKAMYNALSPEVKQYAKNVAKEIAAQESVLPGNPAPDLIGLNPDGKEIKLSDLKGKTVLIDFWATWCVPCRKGLPHVKACYDKYHDRGFEVFTVADNDSSADKWKKVVVEEGMQNYYNILRGLRSVTDANGQFAGFDRTNDQSEKYAVHFLPTKYLIGADGNIVARIENDEQLDTLLSDIFNKQ